MKQYDIAIIGGGMVGATLACALRDTAFNIVLVDAAPLTATIDHRLIALTYNSCTVFKNLQLWETLRATAAAIKEIHVSNRGHFGAARIRANEVGMETLGFLIPAKDINAALTQQLATMRNLTLLRPAQLIALSQDDGQATLTISQENTTESFTAKIVIGADGTFSTVRTLLALPTEEFDYQQKALVVQTELQRDHYHVAYERFLPTGAIAMLPLAERRVATIWSDTAETIDALLKLSDAEFLAELQQQFGFRLGKITKTHARACYPLKFVKAKEQIAGRVILIGNAAHTLHPIASQGLNLSLYEVAVLAEKFSAQTSALLTVPTDLADYFKQQKISLNLSHRLTQLFSADFFGLNAARQMGLMGLDICSVAKRRFIKHAIGSAEHMPNLFFESE